MMSETPHWKLPLILTNQASKEITHNEALNRIDALIAGVVESLDQGAPPTAPAEGELWIVGASATGEWAGHDSEFAHFSGGIWRFFPAADGMHAWLKDRGVPARFSAGSWIVGEINADRLLIAGQQVIGSRQPAIADPSGGTTIDTEARNALSAVLATLRSHGLIAP
ncbi:MAG: DUF2793 domain-containing protein [Alphaproteobacteria bacterium]|nr:MAG: DUF2793 domain-containing protein [Alphaproteobacteria bacterium]